MLWRKSYFFKQGASDRVIVVGAHYDCVEQTFGTDDNASGVGVLLELASIYSTKNLRILFASSYFQQRSRVVLAVSIM